jgi:feruloyl esterase
MPQWAAMSSPTIRLLMLTAGLAAGTAATAAAATCESLLALELTNATITSARMGSPANVPNPDLLRGLPAFCRVTATLTPTSDSDIKMEVWLPAPRAEGAPGDSGWNQKLQSVGNAAWGGAIPYPALAAAVAAGYAAAASDTGHVGNTAKFVPGHPEKLIDYGYRAVHEMTVAAKAIVAAFYESPIRRAYWNGCSTGGRQGLMEALRYPADYDGIVAGAPVNYRTNQLTWELWIAQAVHRSEASYIPPAKYPALKRAALDACDANDGLKDGLIDDPRSCRFDPMVIQCTAGDGPSCLTAPQVEAARQIYSPAVAPSTKKEIFPPLMPGSEMAWGSLAGPQPVGEAVEFFQYVVFNDPAWDYKTLSFDTAAEAADKAAGRVLNVIDPNLKPFFDRGGKLLMYHGWNDQFVAPVNSINYYTSVLKGPASRSASDSMRLFMAPGMNHCRGGDGPSSFDAVGALDRWVERGQAPDRLDASHATDGRVDRTRPLCAYPKVARYNGSGSIDDAANFSCRAP